MRINQTQLGAIIARLRKRLGLTQEQMGSKLGLSTNYINKLENGKRGIGINTLNAVANALGVPAELLAVLASEPTGEPRSVREQLRSEIQSLTNAAIDFYVDLKQERGNERET